MCTHDISNIQRSFRISVKRATRYKEFFFIASGGTLTSPCEDQKSLWMVSGSIENLMKLKRFVIKCLVVHMLFIFCSFISAQRSSSLILSQIGQTGEFC